MRKKLRTIFVATGFLASLATVPAFGQADDHSKMGKMSGTQTTHEEMMAKLDKMSINDKAALIDKMSAKDKTAAMKAGQDVSKMSTQEKADMFDKMPMDKKMAMMHGGDSTMHKGMKMDKGSDKD